MTRDNAADSNGRHDQPRMIESLANGDTRPIDTSNAPTATHDEVAARAHQIYLSHGGLAGRCVQNWLDAEAQLARADPAPGHAPSRSKSRRTPPRQT